MTTLLPPNVKVHLALGFIDMPKGIDGLSMLVQGVLHQDPFTGHLFVFRGRTRANLIKIIFWDGTGFCLFTKRLKVEPDSVCGTKESQMSLTPWELTTKRLTMARDEHNKAAEHHENAAKAHRSAAEHHGKGDHAKGKEHANVAKQHSQTAHQHTDQAHSKSQQQK
jgi:transposase